MKKWVAVVLLLAGCAGLSYKPVLRSITVKELKRRLAQQDDLRQRWQTAGDFYRSLLERNYPVEEDGKLYFFYWDEQGIADISLVMEHNYWLPGQFLFKRLAKTPLLYCAVKKPLYAPLRYRIQAGKEWLVDSRNPDTRYDGAGELVSYWHPAPALWPDWLQEPQARLRGTVQKVRMVSRYTTKPVQMLVYRPHGYRKAQKRGLILIFDDFKQEEAVLYRMMLDAEFSRLHYPAIAAVVVDAEPVRSLYGVRGSNLTDLLEKELFVRLRKEEVYPDKKYRPGLSLSGREAGQLLTLIAGGETDFEPLVLRQPELRYYQGYMNYYLRRKQADNAPAVLVLTNSKPPAGLPEVLKKLSSVAPAVTARSTRRYVKNGQEVFRRLDKTRELISWLLAAKTAGSFPKQLQ